MDKRHYNHKELQKIREQFYTQEKIADKIKKHPKTISRAETGESASFDLLTNIMTACGRSVKEIIYDTPHL